MAEMTKEQEARMKAILDKAFKTGSVREMAKAIHQDIPKMIEEDRKRAVK